LKERENQSILTYGSSHDLCEIYRK